MQPAASESTARQGLIAEGSMLGRRSLSGIQPSGRVHIGNYFGAMKQHIDLQDQAKGYYFVANYHSLTSLRDGETLKRLTTDVALDYLAAGLDPKKSVLYRQSDVPEVLELAWILSCQIGMGDLERAVSYKDKVERGLAANVGLFTYPVLMAADILIVKAEVVPVGEDQLQHIEMARRFATRLHTEFKCDIFPMPQARLTEAKIVPGIDGAKMSKSYGNDIPMFEDPKVAKKRIMAIKTDSTPVEAPKDPDACHILAIMALMASPEEMAEWRERYKKGGTGYGDVKKRLAELYEQTFGPMRERRQALAARPDDVEDILRDGAARARSLAEEVMDQVRRVTGILRGAERRGLWPRSDAAAGGTSHENHACGESRGNLPLNNSRGDSRGPLAQ